MTLTTFFRHLRRDSRGTRSKLAFFVACLAIGVAAVVAVAGFTEGIDRGVRAEARQILAADMAVRGQKTIPDELKAAIDEVDGSQRTEIAELLTLVAADNGQGGVNSQLVELKSLDGTYPFYGDLELEPAGSIANLLDENKVVTAPELLSRLGIRVGDTLRIGGADFEVSGIVTSEPDRIAGAFSMGPRVFVSAAGLQRADLIHTGSRIVYRTLIALPVERADELEALATNWKELLPEDQRYRLETYREAQPALRRGLDRMERYLGLAALLSLLIGGVGVAQTVRSWLSGRMDAIAVLKCLGYRPREVLWLYLGQAAALGLFASVIGIVLGLGVEFLGARAVAGVLPVEHLDLWQPWAMLRGLLLGTGIAVLFSVPPLLAAQRVPPIRVLRRDAEPVPPSRAANFAVGGGLFVAVLALASWQASSILVGLQFMGALAVVTLLLVGAAWGLVRMAARPRQLARLWMRQGLAALARPGAGTLGATVALGLGILVIMTMFLVERRLSAQFDEEMPSDAPNAFLIDIQPDQWPDLSQVLDEESHAVDSVPVVIARLRGVDGKTVDQILENKTDDRWALRREQRLTYLPELDESNEILQTVEGVSEDSGLWVDPDKAEISVEEEYAEAIGVGVGSVVELDIQGVPLELHVTSIRKIDWSSFGINFYLLVEPGVLEDAPQHRIATVRLPTAREQALQDQLAAQFPNVTMVRIQEVLERVIDILQRLGLGIRLLGLLTVLAGLMILAGAVSATAVRRGAEVALLKTLGMTRRQVIAGFATEYALVGLVAGVIGSLGAGLLSWIVVAQMEIEFVFEPLIHLGAVGAAMFLAVTAGLVASTWALQHRPIEALRSAE